MKFTMPLSTFLFTLCSFILLPSTDGFTPMRFSCSHHSSERPFQHRCVHSKGRFQNAVLVFNMAEENEMESLVTKTPSEEPNEEAAVATSVEEVPSSVTKEEKPYPLDVPSPILLATSMVLAIASVGSLFELISGGSPQFGFAVSAGIALIGLPLTGFLFYAAILKATAETEADDEAYLQGK